MESYKEQVEEIVNQMNLKLIVGCVTFGILLFVILVLSFVSRPSTESKNFQVKSLILACSQWYEASKKDKNRVAALMHANYAMAFLHAARSLSPDQEIEEIMNISIEQFIQNLEKQQQYCLDEMKPVEEKAAKRPVFRPRQP